MMILQALIFSAVSYYAAANIQVADFTQISSYGAPPSTRTVMRCAASCVQSNTCMKFSIHGGTACYLGLHSGTGANYEKGGKNTQGVPDIGTTTHLEEVFIGRCWFYQLFHSPSIFGTVLKDCNALYETFLDVFVRKQSCGAVEQEDYKKFLEMANHSIPEDMSIFGSGTDELGLSYGKVDTKHYSLEQSLPGYILNRLNWCGSTMTVSGMNFDTCPAFKSCKGHAVSNYWGAASANYVQLASGVVTVMLNGSMPGRMAFRNDSFFAQVELVGLKIPTVHTLKVWIIHDLDLPITEQCGMGTPNTLEQLATGMGLTVTCENNPPEILALLCVDKPDSPDCNF